RRMRRSRTSSQTTRPRRGMATKITPITPHSTAKCVRSRASGATEPRYRRMVYRRLKQSYSPTYLTILSIIQGVATGNLASVVAAGHEHFTVVQWLLTLNSFVVLIIIWNVFSVQSVLWGWIPDVRDGAVPFVVGALELFLNNAIAASLSAWLIALALIGI